MAKFNKLAMQVVKSIKEFDDDNNPKVEIARETIKRIYQDIEAFNTSVFDHVQEIAKRFDLTVPELIGLPVKSTKREAFRGHALNPFLQFVLASFTEYDEHGIRFDEYTVEAMADRLRDGTSVDDIQYCYKGAARDALVKLERMGLLKKRDGKRGKVWYSVDNEGDYY